MVFLRLPLGFTLRWVFTGSTKNLRIWIENKSVLKICTVYIVCFARKSKHDNVTCSQHFLPQRNSNKTTTKLPIKFLPAATHLPIQLRQDYPIASDNPSRTADAKRAWFVSRIAASTTSTHHQGEDLGIGEGSCNAINSREAFLATRTHAF